MGQWELPPERIPRLRRTRWRPESGRPIVFSRASADYDEGPDISAAQAIDGKQETHWGVHPRYGEIHEAVFEVKDPATSPDGATLTFLLEHQAGAPGHGIGRFRLSTSEEDPAASVLQPLSVDLRAILHAPPSERTPARRQELALA